MVGFLQTLLGGLAFAVVLVPLSAAVALRVILRARPRTSVQEAAAAIAAIIRAALRPGSN